MDDLIRKVLDCEIKKLGDRSYEFTASTSTVDRDGEIIEAAGWDLKNFKKNPVIMYAHNYRDLPIGRAPRVWISDGKLKNVVEFPPEGTHAFADVVERLVDTGYLRTESVGFIPKKWEDGDGDKAPRRTYTKQELLEISIVPVPANPDALRNAVEDGVISTKELDTLFEDDVVNKPEETETHIRIPVRDCKVTATIDISKKEGIQALYCGKIKKVRTYIFDKRPPYNWTMARAEAWVKDHDSGKDLDELPEGMQIEEKGAIPYRRTPLAPEGTDWDAGREVREAEVSDLKIMCAIVEGDPDNKTSYKLPHHKASGEHACVWRAVAASAAVLMGARGGVQAPAASIAGAKVHIGKHYKDFDKGDPPWEKGISQAEVKDIPRRKDWECEISQEGLKDELDFLIKLVQMVGLNDEAKEVAWELVREVMRLAGDDTPDDIAEKLGAVLNAKNKERLNQIKALAQAILNSANKPEESDDDKKEALPKLEIAKMVAEAVKDEFDRLRGKVS